MKKFLMVIAAAIGVVLAGGANAADAKGDVIDAEVVDEGKQ